jgi:pyruvate kinase
MKKVILYTQDRAPVVDLEGAITSDALELDAIAASAVKLAEQLKVEAIIAKTKTGAAAEAVAAYRPNLPIISMTSSARTAQQLALRYANRPYVREDGEGTAYKLGLELKETGYFGDADDIRVAIVSGRQPGVPGTTDTIRVRVLE